MEIVSEGTIAHGEFNLVAKHRSDDHKATQHLSGAAKKIVASGRVRHFHYRLSHLPRALNYRNAR
jgi:hypothetical protein